MIMIDGDGGLVAVMLIDGGCELVVMVSLVMMKMIMMMMVMSVSVDNVDIDDDDNDNGDDVHNADTTTDEEDIKTLMI